MAFALRVEKLGKSYAPSAGRSSYRTLREALMRPFRRSEEPVAPQRWVLRDVSFEIQPAEVVGVIGRNGAGKSTLLKILARITDPTEGYAELRGRVQSLLEVGTGFHPELSGLENVYLSGAIMGMRRSEVARRVDAIVAFAELADFVDVPVKHYSSGMYARLAFAVAAHLEPDILLVDEVLAVGDVAFQRKCIGRMSEVARGGRTVLFVSHDIGAVGNLCHRGILLDGGRVRAIGPAREVLATYVNEVAPVVTAVSLADRQDRAGDGRIRFTSVRWESADGRPLVALRSGDDVRLVLEYRSDRAYGEVAASFGLRDPLRGFVLLHQTAFSAQVLELPRSARLTCTIPRLPLTAGDYLLNLHLSIRDVPSDSIEDAATVRVEYGDFFGTGHPGRGELCRTLAPAHWEVRG